MVLQITDRVWLVPSSADGSTMSSPSTALDSLPSLLASHLFSGRVGGLLLDDICSKQTQNGCPIYHGHHTKPTEMVGGKDT